MTKSILCAVTIGILVGVTAFFAPKMLLGIFILCLVLRLFHCCGHRHHSRGRFFYMADKIRTMSDEEYDEFKTQMAHCSNNSAYHLHKHCCCKTKSKCECKTKNEETTK